MLFTLLLLVCAARALALECTPSQQLPQSVETAARPLAVSFAKATPAQKDQILARLADAADPVAQLIYPYSLCVAHGGFFHLQHRLFELVGHGREPKPLVEFFAILGLVKKLVQLATPVYVDGPDARGVLVNYLTGEARLSGLSMLKNKSDQTCTVPDRPQGHACTVAMYAQNVDKSGRINFWASAGELFELEKQNDLKKFLAALDEHLADMRDILSADLYIDSKGVQSDATPYADRATGVSVAFSALPGGEVNVTLRCEQFTHVYHYDAGTQFHDLVLCMGRSQCVSVGELPALTGWLPRLDAARAYKLSFKLEQGFTNSGRHTVMYAIAAAVPAEEMQGFAVDAHGKMRIEVVAVRTRGFGVCVDARGRLQVSSGGVTSPATFGLNLALQPSMASLKLQGARYYQSRIHAGMHVRNGDDCEAFEMDFRAFDAALVRALDTDHTLACVAFDAADNALAAVAVPKAVKPYNRNVAVARRKTPHRGVLVYARDAEFLVYVVDGTVSRPMHSDRSPGATVAVRLDAKTLVPVYAPDCAVAGASATMWYDMSQCDDCFLTSRTQQSQLEVQVARFPFTEFAAYESVDYAPRAVYSDLFVLMTDDKMATVVVCVRQQKKAPDCRVLRDKIDLRDAPGAAQAKKDFTVVLPDQWRVKTAFSFAETRRYTYFDGKLMVKRFDLGTTPAPEYVLECGLDSELVDASNTLRLFCRSAVQTKVRSLDDFCDQNRPARAQYQMCGRNPSPTKKVIV